MGCLAWCIVRGRQRRRARPRWLSGQHLFHLLAGSYQQQRCHTHCRRKKGHSLQSLRKHACFCLSCKQTLGPLTGPAFAFHKAGGAPVVSDHILAGSGSRYRLIKKNTWKYVLCRGEKVANTWTHGQTPAGAAPPMVGLAIG